MEYRQAELRLEQLHTQIRMQVVNAMFALTNDRAQVKAVAGSPGLRAAEPGCGTEEAAPGCFDDSAVLQQERNLATAENNLIAAHAAPTQRIARDYTRRWPRPAALRHQPHGGGVGNSAYGPNDAGSAAGEQAQPQHTNAEAADGSAAGQVVYGERRSGPFCFWFVKGGERLVNPSHAAIELRMMAMAAEIAGPIYFETRPSFVDALGSR